MNNVYHLPAEWHPQYAVMLTWPHKNTDWIEILSEVEPVYLAISQAVTARQHLIICCHSEAEKSRVASLLAEHLGETEYPWHIYVSESNDTWARDHGPITILDEQNKAIICDFKFNAWGGKFDFELDDKINDNLHRQGAFGSANISPVDFIMEGGSIESDGKGTLLTTSQCLLTDTRNAGYSRQDVESVLAKTLGSNRILWLDHGYLAGDDTDSHIDTLARFCDEDTICYVACENPDDEHHTALQAMQQELKALRKADGTPYQLVPLPMVSPIYDDDHRLPATYANFLIINNAVLFPIYDTEEDQPAIDAIQSCFPDREIVAINCLPLIKQHGSLHCITMQIPQEVIAR